VAIGCSWPHSHPLERLGIFKAKRISPFADVKSQIEEIKSYNPFTLHSLPSSLSALTREAIESGVQGINPSLIFTLGELLDDYTRSQATRAFGAEVYDIYGTTESGVMYTECVEHHGYHSWGTSVIVEITRDGEVVSPGKEGDVTFTTLINHAMPFIRYDLEDIGALVEGECPCGNCFPRMRLTEGRKREVIRLSDGRVVPAVWVIGYLPQIRGVKQFQIVQEDLDTFSVSIVKGIEFSTHTFEEIREKLNPVLGDVVLDLSVVDEIPREKSGKLRPFITKVQAK
jgi:phenylacetate-CoA ligase